MALRAYSSHEYVALSHCIYRLFGQSSHPTQLRRHGLSIGLDRDFVRFLNRSRLTAAATFILLGIIPLVIAFRNHDQAAICMNFLKKIFFSGDSRPTEPPVMKTINYRGGVVTFRIPASWKEEYSDTDGGTFYEDKPDSGTLRLKLITAESPSEITSDSAASLLNTLSVVKGQVRRQPNGNAFARYEEESVDSGQRIRILYWLVANPVPPKHARIATFSYTVLQGKESQSATMHDIQMLENEILQARFATELGN